MTTNRDLYLKVTALLDQHADDGPELADYLVALHDALAVRGNDDGIAVDDFVEALSAAVSSVPCGAGAGSGEADRADRPGTARRR